MNQDDRDYEFVQALPECVHQLTTSCASSSSQTPPPRILDFKTNIFGHCFLPRALYLRECYEQLFQCMLASDDHSHFVKKNAPVCHMNQLIVSTPGIGKTIFAAFLLCRYAAHWFDRNDSSRPTFTVVYEDQMARYGFVVTFARETTSHATIDLIESRNLRSNAHRASKIKVQSFYRFPVGVVRDDIAWLALSQFDTVYICDADAVIRTRYCVALTIVISSPTLANFRGWAKEKHNCQRSMPIWSWTEIKECFIDNAQLCLSHRSANFSQLNTFAAHLETNFALIGGVPRPLINYRSTDSTKIQDTLHRILPSLRIDDVFHLQYSMISATPEQHWFFHDVTNDQFEMIGLDFSTQYIAEWLVKQKSTHKRQELADFLVISTHHKRMTKIRQRLLHALVSQNELLPTSTRSVPNPSIFDSKCQWCHHIQTLPEKEINRHNIASNASLWHCDWNDGPIVACPLG